jgi:ABC-type antimicrobial peptide transport system permease subunit
VILIAFFAVTALLAIPGVFGVMAYSLSRRTRKFGVRVAPGATPADLVPMVLGQGMRTILIGVAIESVGSLALTQTVSLLFGVTDRSGHIRGSDAVADGSGAAGLLAPGQARDETGSDGGVAVPAAALAPRMIPDRGANSAELGEPHLQIRSLLQVDAFDEAHLARAERHDY